MDTVLAYLRPIADLVAVAADLPEVLKTGWGLVICWLLLQCLWYQRIRVVKPQLLPVAVKRPARPKTKSADAGGFELGLQATTPPGQQGYR